MYPLLIIINKSTKEEEMSYKINYQVINFWTWTIKEIRRNLLITIAQMKAFLEVALWVKTKSKINKWTAWVQILTEILIARVQSLLVPPMLNIHSSQE